jgi:hypothetical protein
VPDGNTFGNIRNANQFPEATREQHRGRCLARAGVSRASLSTLRGRGRTNRSLARCRERNRLDLDKLIGVAKNRDTNQRAGRVVVPESAGDFIPRHDEIVPTAAGNKDGRLEHITNVSATLFQDNPHVVERLACLRGDITRSNDSPLIVERTRTRGNDQPGLWGGRGVCIRHARK